MQAKKLKLIDADAPWISQDVAREMIKEIESIESGGVPVGLMRRDIQFFTDKIKEMGYDGAVAFEGGE